MSRQGQSFEKLGSLDCTCVCLILSFSPWVVYKIGRVDRHALELNVSWVGSLPTLDFFLPLLSACLLTAEAVHTQVKGWLR